MLDDQAPSDHLLLRRIRDSGDTDAAEALELLIARHYAVLHRYAVSRIRSLDIAEDILQDVFFRLWRRRREIGTPMSVVGYLFAATRNSIFDHEAAESNRKRRELESSAGQRVVADPPIPTFEFDEVERLVDDAVADLPAKCREIFELVRGNGLTYPDAAAVLGVSLSTVKTQMSRAMSALVRKLGEK